MKTNNNEKINELKTQLTLTFGSDPECFIYDTFDKKIVSAIDVLKKDKYSPIYLGRGVTTYYDNAMLEYTIEPATTKKEFVDNFRDAIEKINLYLFKEYEGRFKLITQASHEFNSEQLEHEEAKRVGCNPEFNADKVIQITPPDFDGNLRSAGGHLSVGRADFKDVIEDENADLINFESKLNLVKLLDYFVGVPFTLIDNDETSLRRRKIYGTPSSHRPKPFGIEYRVLSCGWTASPVLVSLIYDLCYHAVDQLLNNKTEEIFSKFSKDMVNAAITENNKELSAEILESIQLPKSLSVRLNQLKDVKSWDLYKEWKLTDYSKVSISKASKV